MSSDLRVPLWTIAGLLGVCACLLLWVGMAVSSLAWPKTEFWAVSMDNQNSIKARLLEKTTDRLAPIISSRRMGAPMLMDGEYVIISEH